MELESEAVSVLQYGQAVNEQADLYVLNSVVLAHADVSCWNGPAVQEESRSSRDGDRSAGHEYIRVVSYCNLTDCLNFTG